MTLSAVLQLAIAGLLPVAASILLYIIDKKTPFGKLNFWVKQAVFGVIFGGIAVVGTEWGIRVLGVTLNVRDVAPICAGLIFGAPAGIIAGAIGALERFFAAYWGAGTYTQIACTAATLFSGLFAAWQRKYMFDDRKPAWYYGLAAGIVCEVIHMLLVFITNMSDIHKAFSVVKQCAIPMILAVGLSVALAVLAISLIGKEKFNEPKEKVHIVQVFQRRLLVCVVFAFLVTSFFTYRMQAGVSDNDATKLLEINISDVKQDINDASDENLLSIARRVADEVNGLPSYGREKLSELASKYEVSEINIINKNGIIYKTTEPKFMNYDMHGGEQAAEFLTLFDGEVKELAQGYGAASYGSSFMRKYAGVVLDSGEVIQVGYDANRFHKDLLETVTGITRNRRIGSDGCIIITNNDLTVVSDRNGSEGMHVYAVGMDFDRKVISENERFEATVYGEECYCMYTVTEGYYIIGAMTKSEALFSRDMSVYLTTFMEVIIFTVLFILIYFLIKNLIVNNIRKINNSLSRITDGDLDETVDVRTSLEFASLSDDINSTVITLKHYIDEAAQRIDKELEFAKAIQESALPNIFPPYPNRNEFDIWAGMMTAKEVGGDFYDFYLIGEDKLAFLVADVSGKGIPAAMFMMTAKTTLKNLAESGLAVNEVFTRANNQLCENNDAGMFVTSWMGILDLKTGLVEFANAGHNPPLVKHKDGEYEYLRSKAGFVLAGMEGINYRLNELQLQSGDTIYLYTDGVTEATDADNNLYGEERLKNCLDNSSGDMKAVCLGVKEDVDKFVGDAPQFDDITMLGIKYNGRWGAEKMNEITVDATVENVSLVTAFVEEQLEKISCPTKTVFQINVAIDEIFSNIARYAYTPETGKASVRFEHLKEENAVRLTFTDSGKPFDPLKVSAPDTTLSAEERDIGGLGIFMVRKSMNEVNYEYKDGRNILTVIKKL